MGPLIPGRQGTALGYSPNVEDAATSARVSSVRRQAVNTIGTGVATIAAERNKLFDELRRQERAHAGLEQVSVVKVRISLLM